MYSYKTGIRPIDEVTGGLEPGSNILILAPPMSGAEKVGFVLARPREGEYTIILSTDQSSLELTEDLMGSSVAKDHVGVIDSITKMSTPDAVDTLRVKYIASPSDLTGIGIKFSQLAESIFKGEFDRSGELFPPPVRFYTNSLSTLLMYRKLEVLYQFLHVLNAKLKKMDAIGIYTLNSESFDERTISLMKQLMNLVIEIKEENDGGYLRIRGKPEIAPEWKKFHIEHDELMVGP